MLLSFLLFAVVFCFEDAAQEQFRAYKESHNKVYSSVLEEKVRFVNFLNTVKEIERLNNIQKIHGGATFGVNKFSDMSDEEFIATYLQPTKEVPAPHEFFSAKQSVATTAAELDVDWRRKGYVTPVKSQGPCGSCWAFAAVEAVESAFLMKGTQIKPLAPQQLVDCVGKENGCKGEFPANGLKYAAEVGLLHESVYPYKAKVQNCSLPSPTKATYHKITNFHRFYSHDSKTEENIYKFHAAKGPVIIHNLDVAGWRSYKKGILTPAQCKPERAFHAPQIVGWNLTATTSTEKYWLIRNTWGEDWGEKGYIRLQYGNNTCGMGQVLTLVALV